MAVLAPVGKQGLQSFDGSTGKPQALHNTFFYDTRGHGVPRRENLLGLRVLEATHAAQIPMDTIRAQVTGTPWMIRTPEGFTETGRHRAAATDIEDFLDGNFNANGESFNSLLKKWVGDVLSIDSGILELVPDEKAYLAEIYARDGATFTKAPDRYGRLPRPGSTDPAYWQFSLHAFAGTLDPKDALFDVIREGTANPGAFRPFHPIPFSRDQLVWTEAFPRTWDTYGLGRVQLIRRISEILLNQDYTNLKFFRANEVPEGLLQFLDANEDEIKRFRAYWTQEVKGREHKLPIVGGKEGKWIPFRPSMVDLQFLDSQKWYHELGWLVFGLSPNEVGHVEDVNRSTGTEQGFAVYRKTTKPLLDLMAQEINRRILVYTKSYRDVNGEIEFAWDFDTNPAIKALRRQRQKEDLETGLATINEVRMERGSDPLPWGDFTSEMVREFTRRYPRWVMEKWGNVEEEDLPEETGLDVFSLNAAPDEAKVVAAWDGHGGYEALLCTAAPLLKDALRNEPAHPFPKVKGIMDALATETGLIFTRLGEDVEAAVRARFKSTSFDITAILDSIDIAPQLRDAVIAAGRAAMQEAAAHHAARAAKELEERLGPEAPEVEFRFEVQDTNAFKHLAARAATRMRTVNDTVKRLIRDTLVQVMQVDGGNVTDAEKAIHRLFGDQITRDHARLVARTEVLQASRNGSQAFAESTSLIAGKGWRATKDNRTRPWHAIMDGVVVPKDDVFEVPVVDRRQANRGYPKRVRVVGDDEPFNCRCDQYPVLADDLPHVLALGAVQGLHRKHEPAFTDDLSDQQRGVLFAKGRKDEAFDACIQRLYQEAGSMNALSRSLDVPRTTLYGWLPESARNG